MNLFEVETAADDDDPRGYEVPYARVGAAIGAIDLGLSIYDIAPGNSICPYHYEVGEEEWLFVLAGTPTLRDPDGEHVLEEGDVVCFPSGPDGAHKVTNESAAAVRVGMLSTHGEHGYTIYPDSNKVNVWHLRKIFRAEDAVDYWDRELSPER